MRLHPIRHIIGNLIVTRFGTVWAVWRVSPQPYRHATDADRRDLLDRTEALLRSLRGEVMLLSLCAPVDRDELAERMLQAGPPADADLRGWGELVDAGEELLDEYALTRRTHWLAMPLPIRSPLENARLAARTAAARVMERAGVPPAPISQTEVERWVGVADRIAATIPGLSIRPASPGEILWIHHRAALRGLDEPVLHVGDQGGSRLWDERVVGPSLAGLAEVHLDEGNKHGRALSNPFARRLVRLTHANTPTASSYQAFLAAAEFPATFAFPGGEFLDKLDDLGVAVDWVARLDITGRDAAESRNRRRARELSEQVDQRGTEAGGPEVPGDLEQAYKDLDELRGRLATSASEVEVQANVALCVWSDNPETCDQDATSLQQELAPQDYQLVRVTGGQTALYQAMLPGYPTPRVLTDFRQYFLARDFAMLVPFGRTEIGDPTGALLGLGVDTSGVQPVLHDPTHGPRDLDTSASVGVCGDLGAGKSTLLKRLLDIVVRSGGLGLVVDRTPSAEWERAAHALPGATQVLHLTHEARFSIDPLRVFARPEEAHRHCEGLIGLLLGLDPLSTEGAVLGDAIGDVLGTDTPSMAALVDNLANRDSRAASELHQRLQAARRLDLARVLFDPELPVLHTNTDDVDTIVFNTHEISLPTREELTNSDLLRQMPPEKRIGRSIMYLIAGVCRQVAFDVNRYAGVFLDECYWLTSSTEGERLALELIRDGRKHDAGIYLAGHAPSDIGGDVLSGLLGQRFLFRQRDAEMARQSLRWMGLEPDPRLVDIVRGLAATDLPKHLRAERAGECLYRDVRGRMGRLKVVVPDMMSRALSTTPGHPTPHDDDANSVAGNGHRGHQQSHEQGREQVHEQGDEPARRPEGALDAPVRVMGDTSSVGEGLL